MAFNKGINAFKVLLNAILTVWDTWVYLFSRESSIKIQKRTRPRHCERKTHPQELEETALSSLYKNKHELKSMLTCRATTEHKTNPAAQTTTEDINGLCHNPYNKALSAEQVLYTVLKDKEEYNLFPFK